MVALTWCDLYLLGKEDLDNLLDFYPEIATEISKALGSLRTYAQEHAEELEAAHPSIQRSLHQLLQSKRTTLKAVSALSRNFGGKVTASQGPQAVKVGLAPKKTSAGILIQEDSNDQSQFEMSIPVPEDTTETIKQHNSIDQCSSMHCREFGEDINPSKISAIDGNLSLEEVLFCVLKTHEGVVHLQSMVHKLQAHQQVAQQSDNMVRRQSTSTMQTVEVVAPTTSSSQLAGSTGFTDCLDIQRVRMHWHQQYQERSEERV